MFNQIAGRYDFANHWLSGGVDYYWRARACRLVARWQPKRILDLATGSGDLALALQRRLPTADITAADFSREMLERARAKGVRKTVEADAMQLPFADGAFDCVTVAFGLRNMQDWPDALREMRRVLASGGHLLALDFSEPRPFARRLYRFYLHRVLPVAAGWLTRNRNAYAYLAGSIEKFPSGTAMTELLTQAGFSRATATPLTAGIATIYTGDVIG